MQFKILLILHLLGSAVWVGGHLVLSIGVLPRALKLRDVDIIKQFESRYEKVGIPALLLQVVSGFWLAYTYVDNIFDAFRFDTAQHSSIALKIILLLLTICIAAHARIRLIGKLKEENMMFLAWHIITITTIAVAILVLGVTVRTGW